MLVLLVTITFLFSSFPSFFLSSFLSSFFLYHKLGYDPQPRVFEILLSKMPRHPKFEIHQIVLTGHLEWYSSLIHNYNISLIRYRKIHNIRYFNRNLNSVERRDFHFQLSILSSNYLLVETIMQHLLLKSAAMIK